MDTSSSQDSTASYSRPACVCVWSAGHRCFKCHSHKDLFPCNYFRRWVWIHLVTIRITPIFPLQILKHLQGTQLVPFAGGGTEIQKGKGCAQGQHSGLGSETELPNPHPTFLPQRHIISTDEPLASLSMCRGLDDTRLTSLSVLKCRILFSCSAQQQCANEIKVSVKPYIAPKYHYNIQLPNSLKLKLLHLQDVEHNSTVIHHTLH